MLFCELKIPCIGSSEQQTLFNREGTADSIFTLKPSEIKILSSHRILEPHLYLKAKAYAARMGTD
jgi:hypothetical protein